MVGVEFQYWKATIVLAMAWSASGCASVTSGSQQSLSFATEPSGADCTLSKNNVSLAKFQTPNVSVVARSATPLVIACARDGFQPMRALIGSTTSNAAWGNLVAGGIVGIMIDKSSGAIYKYYDPPRFSLIAAGTVSPPSPQYMPSGITLLPPDESTPNSGQPAPVAAPQPLVSPTGKPATAGNVAVPPAPAPLQSGASRSRL